MPLSAFVHISFSSFFSSPCDDSCEIGTRETEKMVGHSKGAAAGRRGRRKSRPGRPASGRYCCQSVCLGSTKSTYSFLLMLPFHLFFFFLLFVLCRSNLLTPHSRSLFSPFHASCQRTHTATEHDRPYAPRAISRYVDLSRWDADCSHVSHTHSHTRGHSGLATKETGTKWGSKRAHGTRDVYWCGDWRCSGTRCPGNAQTKVRGVGRFVMVFLGILIIIRNWIFWRLPPMFSQVSCYCHMSCITCHWLFSEWTCCA